MQNRTRRTNVHSSTKSKGPYLYYKNISGTHPVLSNICLVFLLRTLTRPAQDAVLPPPSRWCCLGELAGPLKGGVTGWESTGGRPECSAPSQDCLRLPSHRTVKGCAARSSLKGLSQLVTVSPLPP